MAVAIAGLGASAGTASGQASGSGAPSSPGGSQAIFVERAQVEYLEASNVAARIDGILDSIELSEGTRVRRGDPIGYLVNDRAKLEAAKAKIAAESQAGIRSAESELRYQYSKLKRMDSLNRLQPGATPQEEREEQEAQVAIAQAKLIAAQEDQRLSKAEYDIRKRVLDDHTIEAPFDGVIVERLAKPGQSVNVNEPVVRLVNLDKLRVFAYVPYEKVSGLREGDEIEIEPSFSAPGKERKRYRGKITFIDPAIQTVGERSRRVLAEIDNRAYDYEINPGMTATMIIYPNTAKQASTGPGAGAGSEVRPASIRVEEEAPGAGAVAAPVAAPVPGAGAAPTPAPAGRSGSETIPPPRRIVPPGAAGSRG